MSIDNLFKLLDCKMPPDLREWYEQGLERYLDGNENLDPCLGLSRDNPQLAEIRRNWHLRQAAKYLKADKPWTRAVELAAAVERFEQVIWPAWKLRRHPPEFSSELRKELFHARRHRVIPHSRKQLHRILIE